MSKVAVIVPTLNAGKDWLIWLQAFEAQSFKADYCLIVDSSSDDATISFAAAYGFDIRIINRTEFNHGGTRQWAVSLFPDADIYIFLTQDAILNNHDALEKLVNCFDDASIGAAYGRQLPHVNAGKIAAHARLFNYPQKNQIRSYQDRDIYGIKTVFVSNSFAAYRRQALIEVGGFPSNTIMNEDTFIVGKMLLAGWKLAYCADAQVFHSHDYSFLQEFKRYFDIGVFHARCPWLQQTFGGATGEGRRFVISELIYLLKRNPLLLPSAIARTGLKWLGFKLGGMSCLPTKYCIKMSMHKGYWTNAMAQEN